MTINKYGLFRLQLFYGDDEDLAEQLGLKSGEAKKYDVYVVELMDGNLSDKDMIDESNVESVIMQLLDGLSQLKNADKSHNDIKPTNILFKLNEVETYEENDIATFQYITSILFKGSTKI